MLLEQRYKIIAATVQLWNKRRQTTEAFDTFNPCCTLADFMDAGQEAAGLLLRYRKQTYIYKNYG